MVMTFLQPRSVISYPKRVASRSCVRLGDGAGFGVNHDTAHTHQCNVAFCLQHDLLGLLPIARHDLGHERTTIQLEWQDMRSAAQC